MKNYLVELRDKNVNTCDDYVGVCIIHDLKKETLKGVAEKIEDSHNLKVFDFKSEFYGSSAETSNKAVRVVVTRIPDNIL